MHTPIDNVIARLPTARANGERHWIACCPAHDDRTPSLSISVTPDQIVLLKCWAGCSVEEILGAIGLNLHSLFPGNKQQLRCYPSSAAIALEKAVVAIAKATLDSNGRLSAADQRRYQTALQRLAFVGEDSHE